MSNILYIVNIEFLVVVSLVTLAMSLEKDQQFKITLFAISMISILVLIINLYALTHEK